MNKRSLADKRPLVTYSSAMHTNIPEKLLKIADEIAERGNANPTDQKFNESEGEPAL